MDGKDPFLTRSDLREKKRELDRIQKDEQRKLQKESEREYLKREKEIDRFYRKEYKKKEPMKQTRSGENQKSRRMNLFLRKAIGILFIMIVMVILAIIFI